MAAYDSLSEYFNVVTVYASYSLENRRLRTVYVMVNNEEPVTLNLTPSNTAETWAECKRMIEEVIKKDETLPLILSINSNGDEKMLYRDDEAIYGIFRDLQNAYPDSNISIR